VGQPTSAGEYGQVLTVGRPMEQILGVVLHLVASGCVGEGRGGQSVDGALPDGGEGR
jgi:hypothetical protein